MQIVYDENYSLFITMGKLYRLITFVLANDIQEQYSAIHAHHFILIISAHMENIIPKTFM